MVLPTDNLTKNDFKTVIEYNNYVNRVNRLLIEGNIDKLNELNKSLRNNSYKSNNSICYSSTSYCGSFNTNFFSGSF